MGLRRREEYQVDWVKFTDRFARAYKEKDGQQSFRSVFEKLCLIKNEEEPDAKKDPSVVEKESEDFKEQQPPKL